MLFDFHDGLAAGSCLFMIVIALFSYCLIAILPYYHIAILPYCLLALLPYCLRRDGGKWKGKDGPGPVMVSESLALLCACTFW